MHAPLQIPAVHCCVTLLVEQTTPQPPQLLTFAAVLTSQPSVRLLPLQSAKPAVHAPLQTPPPHCAATLLLEQVAPQPPQLFASPFTLTSQPSTCLLPLQSAKPAVHAPLQTPAVHCCATLLPEQTVPQPPQLFAELVVLTSQPLAGLPSQFAKFAVQVQV